MKERLWRRRDVFFDLNKKHIRSGPKGNTYQSDITDIKVTVQVCDSIGNYKRLKHKATTPFYIRGIKDGNGEDISLDNGFPNDPLDDLTVYHATSDSTYRNPLLVILTPKNNGDPRFISGKYYISKYYGSTSWKIRRVEDGIGEGSLKKTLQNIENNERLEVDQIEDEVKNKLTDITEDLIINLECATGDSGKYTSDYKQIPFKKTRYDGYSSISHADIFGTFTIKRIDITRGQPINSQDLIPTGTILSRLKVFYNSSNPSSPLLVYILQSDEVQKWLCRHYGDKQWTDLTGTSETPGSDADFEKIKSLLDKLKTPSITIDLSQGDGSNYLPEGNTHKFIVRRTPVDGSSDYYGLKHTESENKPFTIKSVKHGTTLEGISSSNTLDSISAYYYGDPPGNKENLLLVELVKKTSGSDKCKYFKRENKSQTDWVQESTSGSQLQNSVLLEKLKKLKMKSINILTLNLIQSLKQRFF